MRHLVAEALEAAEPVEHAAVAAPEKHVGVGRQLGAMGAEQDAGPGNARRDSGCTMPSWSMRPNDSAMPPGVQAKRPATTKLAASSISAPSTSAAGAARDARGGAEAEKPRSQRRRRRPARAITAKVALWVATANAISANSALRSQRRSAPSANTRRCTASTASPAKMSVSRMLASHGSVVRTGERRGDAEQQQRPAAEARAREHQRQHPHRQRAWSDHDRPEIGPRQDHQEQAVDGRAARHQIAFEPARQIAAGVVLRAAETGSRSPAQAEGACSPARHRYARHPAFGPRHFRHTEAHIGHGR